MMNLPKAFLTKMDKLLGEDFASFLASFQAERSYGLRANTLKIELEAFLELMPFQLKAIPWVDEGFYYANEERPGKHVYHDLGLYYIQEPSAMAVISYLAPHPGEKILDLAAAPGGKSTQIAAKMQGEGVLVANEIHPSRAKILAQNIERMGIQNAIVTNDPAEKLAKKFSCYFDRIVLDAPCSGEGMFRKDEVAREEWNIKNVEKCANRQADILLEAAKMLKPGGRLVYSTCTFSPEENEAAIAKFLLTHPEFTLEKVDLLAGHSPGRPDWVQDLDVESLHLERTIRIWPHQVSGEGHFIAVLQKQFGEEPKRYKPIQGVRNKKELINYQKFCQTTLITPPKGELVYFGNHLYAVPEEMIDLNNLRVRRAGLHLGENKKGRFEPSHALALALKAEDVKAVVNLKSTDDKVEKYLRGETLQVKGQSGWNLITVDGYSIGWGKLTQETLKNHYPKGLRRVGK